MDNEYLKIITPGESVDTCYGLENYVSCAEEIFENQDRNDILEKRFGIPMVKESEG